MRKLILILISVTVASILFFHVGMFHQRNTGVECIDDIPLHFEEKHDAWSSVFKAFCDENPEWEVETDLASFECFEGYGISWGIVE